MASPDISKSISEGYERGIDRIGQWLPAIAVVGAVTGGIAVLTALLQRQFVPDAGEVFSAILSGQGDKITRTDMRMIGLIGGLQAVIMLVISLSTSAVFSGILHRERHGRQVEAPTPATIVGQVVAAASALMPKLGILAALTFVAQSAQPLLGNIGGILGLLALLASAYLAVLWIYAPVIAGSGEAEGDAAFERSGATVSGNWLGTLIVFVIIGIAVVAPFVIGALIAAAIIGSILPSFLASFALFFVMAFSMPVMASALESAWSQVEDATPPTSPRRPGATGDDGLDD